MNTTISIEKARVVKIGRYMSGKSEQYGEWQRINMKVEWQHLYNDEMGQPHEGKQTAVVTFKGHMAGVMRGYCHVGDEGPNVPKTYLNLKVILDGRLDTVDRKDGKGTWEYADNTLTVVWYEFTDL